MGRNNLLGYVLRPPIAAEHLTFTEEGLVAIPAANKDIADIS